MKKQKGGGESVNLLKATLEHQPKVKALALAMLKEKQAQGASQSEFELAYNAARTAISMAVERVPTQKIDKDAIGYLRDA